ncbi:MAG TPA: YXWGXW repeat-containing protein [Steroidobacteraceae bacterium]|nr:YXWGXW repeat-containing protein [Steroidobacteraceae bacterium]
MIKTAAASLLMAMGLALGALCWPAPAAAQVSFSVTFGPPPLPVYEQPPLPAPGYIFIPGYWYYGPYGYYWVPGTWVEPPAAGLLWTPGYWGWSDGFYVWNPGYWAPQVGFYGGVVYGFGYFGHGYEGGYWRDRHFWYNREVNNITNVHVENVYSRTINNVTVNHVSYVGGPGGLTARPTAEEERVAHEHHVAPTRVQVQHREAAAAHPELVSSMNHGKPEIAATAKPANFQSQVVAASRAGGPVMVHARDLPKPETSPVAAAAPAAKPAANPGSQQAQHERQQQELQARQQELQARQQQERESLAQMQERDHAYMSQQNANARLQAAMEHQHRQQTEFLQQRHAAEMQGLRGSPPHAAAAPPPHAAPPAPAHGPPPAPRGEPPHR